VPFVLRPGPGEHPLPGIPGAAGNTELVRAARLSRRLGFSDLRFKLEGQNPTRTHKDRLAASLVPLAVRVGKPGVTVGSCGNLGVAIAHACSLANLDCHVFVPARYVNSRTAEIAAYGFGVTLIPGTYEDAVRESTSHSVNTGYFDASPLGQSGREMVSACETIALEILAALGRPPASVWVPVGNGTLLAGIHSGFHHSGCVPRIGAVGSRGNTAAIASIIKGVQTELKPSELRESPVNEPLVNWRSFHTRQACEAVVASSGWACEASDGQLVEASELLKSAEGISAPPYACAGLAGLLATGAARTGVTGTHVIVLTGGQSPRA
jgi:threonine synthase